MIEFILFAIVLFVPLSLGMADTSNYFSALMASQSAAREAARGYSLSPSGSLGLINAQRIALTVLGDSGIHYHNFKLGISCSRNPCLSPGGSVTATVDLNMDFRSFSRAIHVEEVEPVDVWVGAR